MYELQEVKQNEQILDSITATILLLTGIMMIASIPILLG